MIKPNLIIVDDHLAYRQGLVSILKMENIASVIAEASNGNEFIELLSHLKPDLVLMDIDMPIMNGVEATQKALELFPDLKIIAFTMFGDDDNYVKMIELGVKGFILKSTGINELEIAIQDVMKGKTCFSTGLQRNRINNDDHKKSLSLMNEVNLKIHEKEVLMAPKKMNLGL